MLFKYRKLIIAAFLVFAIISGFFITKLRISFDFNQFFPQGDPDLAFFEEFIEEFETDDNFLLVAVQHKPTVFDQTFLENFHQFSLDLRTLPMVEQVRSLTQMKYPVKTPFGISGIDIIHMDEPDRYESDRKRVVADRRFVHNLIDENATALVAAIKTADNVDMNESRVLMESLDSMIIASGFEDKAHILGRAYFQAEMVKIQMRELMMSGLFGLILVSIVMMFLFKRWRGILVALISIGLGLLLFMGILGAVGRELSALTVLYPILMLIVGTSDVIHIMSKYIDELKKGKAKQLAMKITIRQIGLATLMTSITTSVGFATLLTSRVIPIREFGLNAAAGVMIAYITVLFFTTSLLSFFSKDQLIKEGRTYKFWDKVIEKCQYLTKNYPRQILGVSAFIIFLSFVGISKITTNYTIENNLPRGEKVTEDFLYFEHTFAGFRPLEFAIFAQGNRKADSYEVLREVDKIDNYLAQNGNIKSAVSLPMLYKSVEQMNRGNQVSEYRFPETEKAFNKSRRLIRKSYDEMGAVMLSKDGLKTRISSKIKDIGADSIKIEGRKIDKWIAENTDPSVIAVRQTGTGLIIDKNSIYIRDNLLKGLGLALIVVSILMAFLFQNARMLIISLIPNLIPLLLSAALLGYLGIEMEAGVSIVFAIVFGIAVDDTIHFLGKFKLCLKDGLTVEEAMDVTFRETGKAIIFTSIILFFGFLIVLFSVHPPSVMVGSLISVTLVGAVIFDLLLLPVLIKMVIKDEVKS